MTVTDQSTDDASTDTGQTSTDTTDTTQTSTDTTTKPETTDMAAEAAKWKELSRKHEERAKANSGAMKELEQLRKASMTDTEKAITEAKAAARAEVLAEVGASLVDAEVRAATMGRQLDADALLDGLNRSRFLGDDGKPDRAAITEWLDRLAPKGEVKRTATDTGQGARGAPAAGAITREQLKTMTSAQIEAARKSGKLDHLLR